MQHTSFDEMTCPIARSLEHVGEWWTMLILRDALAGCTRFDDFHKSLGIAPNMLSRRLSALTKAGMLERRQYSERPPRDEYILTARGHDFEPILIMMMAFGNRHFATEGETVLLVQAASGAVADPIVVDRHTGRPLRRPEYVIAAGPAASDATRARLSRRDAQSAAGGTQR